MMQVDPSSKSNLEDSSQVVTYVAPCCNMIYNTANLKRTLWYRVPGRHYQNYEVMGYDLPEPKEFHAACKACFASRGGAGMPVGGGRDGQSEGDSAASSSDTGSEE